MGYLSGVHLCELLRNNNTLHTLDVRVTEHTSINSILDMLNQQPLVLRDLTLTYIFERDCCDQLVQFLSENSTLARFLFNTNEISLTESHVEVLSRNTTLKVLVLNGPDEIHMWKNILKQCGSLQELGWCWFDLDADFQAFNMETLSAYTGESTEHIHLLNELLRTTQLKELHFNAYTASLGDDFVNAIARNRSLHLLELQYCDISCASAIATNT